MTQTRKIEANSLISILTDLYKQKDSSKVNEDTFKTAFDEAKENNGTVSVDILLQQIESDTGIKLEDFSDVEQEAINATLSALSDDSNNIIDDYDDLYDISPEYFDELQEGASLEKLNYEISNTNGSVDATKIEVKEEQGKKIDYRKGYAQLVTIDGEQKVQVCLDDGTVLLTRDLTEEDKVNFGLKEAESETGSDDASGSSGSVSGGDTSETEAAGTTTGEVTDEYLDSDNFLNDGINDGAGTAAAKSASSETKARIKDLKSRVTTANAGEGIFGKIGGWIKNIFNTKYSAENINEKIAELEALGDNATEEQWSEVEQMVATYERKSGGAADKTGTVAAAGAGLAAGAAAGAAIGSIIPSAGTLVGGLIGAAVGGIVGYLAGGAAKATVGAIDNASSEKKDWSSEITEDFTSGGSIGSAAGSLAGGIKATGAIKAAGAAANSGTKAAAASKSTKKGILGSIKEKVVNLKDKIVNFFKGNKTTPASSQSTTAKGIEMLNNADDVSGAANQAAATAKNSAKAATNALPEVVDDVAKLDKQYSNIYSNIINHIKNNNIKINPESLSKDQIELLTKINNSKGFSQIIKSEGTDGIIDLLSTLENISGYRI